MAYFLNKNFQVNKKKHFQKFLHGSTLELETQTFSCEKPLSALFLLTDSPPGNVSLLPENQNRVNQELSASKTVKSNITL
jgi:hypothetical protein